MRREWHEDRKRRIESAAAELIKSIGWQKVSMKKVAASSGMAVGTLYNYFPSKHDLLSWLFQKRLEDRIKKAPGSALSIEEWISTGFAAYASFTKEEWRSFFAFLYSGKPEGNRLIWESQTDFIGTLASVLAAIPGFPIPKLPWAVRTAFALFFQKFQQWIATDLNSEEAVAQATADIRDLLSLLVPS